jgi:Ca-activated chloride channel homolog
MKKLIVILFYLFPCLVLAQTESEKTLRTADDHYKKGEFAQAAAVYSKIVQAEPLNEKAKFNLANSLYKQDKKLDAVQIYAEINGNSADKSMLNKAWYNKGVILTHQKNIEESIESYKHALRNDPNDKEARENLQKALLELKKKQQENKQPDKQQQKKDQQQKQNKSRMQPKEAEQRLRLLQQKEQQVQERVQKEKTKTGGSQGKDW